MFEWLHKYRFGNHRYSGKYLNIEQFERHHVFEGVYRLVAKISVVDL